MKKTLSIVLIAVMLVVGVFLLTGCGNETEKENGKTTGGSSSSGTTSKSGWQKNEWTDLIVEPTDVTISSSKEYDRDTTTGYRINLKDWNLESATEYVAKIKSLGFSDSDFGTMDFEYKSVYKGNRANGVNSDGVSIEIMFYTEKSTGYIYLTKDK